MFSRLIIGGGGVGGVVYAGLAGRVFFFPLAGLRASPWAGCVCGAYGVVWFVLFMPWSIGAQAWLQVGRRGSWRMLWAGLSGSLACRRAVSSAAGCAIGGPRGWATIGYFFFCAR